MPTRKYAYQPELQQQAKRIAEKHGLYESALFHTEVKSVEWDETNSVWKIATDRGDSFTAQFLGLGTGPLHVPQVPRVAGITDFKGKSFHTSRWDYSYTGGSPEGAPLEHLKDKTVAIIGTGATAVQCVPHLGQSAKRLYVVQRTPTSVDVRADAPLDSEWFSKVAVEKGWQRKWLENFTGNSFGGTAAVDLVQDGWTDMSRRVRLRIAAMPAEQRTPANMMAAFEDSDFGGLVVGTNFCSKLDPNLPFCPKKQTKWKKSAPASTRLSKTPLPHSLSRHGTANFVNAPASTTPTYKHSTSPTSLYSTRTVKASKRSPKLESWPMDKSIPSTVSFGLRDLLSVGSGRTGPGLIRLGLAALPSRRLGKTG